MVKKKKGNNRIPSPLNTPVVIIVVVAVVVIIITIIIIIIIVVDNFLSIRITFDRFLLWVLASMKLDL